MLTVDGKVIRWEVRATVETEDGIVLQERSGVGTIAVEQLTRGFTSPYVRVLVEMVRRLRERLEETRGGGR